MQTTQYKVTGMSCGHCERAIREEVGALAGVADVQVSASSGELRVQHAESVEPSAIISAVDEAGYSAEQVQ